MWLKPPNEAVKPRQMKLTVTILSSSREVCKRVYPALQVLYPQSYQLDTIESVHLRSSASGGDSSSSIMPPRVSVGRTAI